MAAAPVSLVPFYGQYAQAPKLQPGGLAAPERKGGASLAGKADQVDIVDIRSNLPAGRLTAAAGDLFAIRSLYKGSAGGGDIAEYQVALRGDPGKGGRLLLDDGDVTGRQGFTAAEFDRLHFEAGANGSKQDLVVVAQTGKRAADGRLTNVVDSPAVQITAEVTGKRSINALGALLTVAKGADADFVKVAQEASVFTGFGKPRPALTTAGNFEAKEGDLFALRSLYQATAPPGASVAGYKVALRSDHAGPNDGKLLLDDEDVTGRLSFTAEEFGRLHFQAGPSGSKQDLVVVAQTGKRGADGTLSGVIDSEAVQITADVTGERSINAVSALLTAPEGADADFVKVAREASIFTGFGAPRPSLTTAGNFEAKAGDLFALRSLYQAAAPAGGNIAGFKVALRSDQAGPNDGKLLLDDQDVTGRLSFTAEEFGRLHLQVGRSGSKQDLVVVAQTGKRGADGALLQVIDSEAVQITANVTGSRSINAASALLTQASDEDAAFVRVSQEASVFSGFGAPRPSLATVGNLTAAAGDLFALRSLYKAQAPPGGSVAGYKVALRSDQAGGGALLLDGEDVTGRQGFTADEFDRLHFKAGPLGGRQDLVVLAQTGKREANGTLSHVINSVAVQIGVAATGTRSINGAEALLTRPEGADAGFVRLAQEASVFAGFGAKRPGLATVGNISAAGGDLLALRSLYQASAPAGAAIAGYKVALRGEAGGSGRLLLDDADVTGQGSFTADEFARLHFEAGPLGSKQDLLVVAQLGKRGADGALSSVVNSPAVQISANVNGSRSLNAVSALLTAPKGADAAFIKVAREAGVFTGFGGPRPALSTGAIQFEPQGAVALLAYPLGAFYSTQPSSGQAGPVALPNALGAVSAAVGLRSGAGAVGSAQARAAAILAWAQSGEGQGGALTAGDNFGLRRFAVAAYRTSQRFD